MDIFSIDVTYSELVFIRQTLDLPSISGRDAKFVANLQAKVESEIYQIEQMKLQEEENKKKQLEEIIATEQKSSKSK